MGANLALNLGDEGFRLSVYNRTTAVTAEFVAAHGQQRPIMAAAAPSNWSASWPGPASSGSWSPPDGRSRR